MKGIFRFIKKYASSFLILFLLITAGTVCFTAPWQLDRSIRGTVLPYLTSQNRSDAVIRSALGFGAAEREAVRNLPGVAEVAESFSSPAILSARTLVRKVTVLSLTETEDRPELISGRLPEAYDECVLSEDYQALSVQIGDTVILYPAAEEESLPLRTDSLKVVGFVRHPAFLHRDQGDFLLVHPALPDRDGDLCQQLLIRSGTDRAALFSPEYEEKTAELRASLEAFGVRFAADKLIEQENAILQEKAAALADINARLSQLEADENALAGQSGATESHINELQQEYNKAKEEWEAAQAVRDATYAHFETLRDELQEKESRLEQLQAIDKIVRGELTQVETVLSNNGLKPMLLIFRGCAESILSAFLKADLTKPAVMESAVESARNRWESEWETFRTSLSAEDAHEIEHSISRSLVSLGIEISNQLRDYGNTLQSAGAQNAELQGEIRTIVNERGSGALSTAIYSRIAELRNEISAQEQEFNSCSEVLEQDDAVLKEKQETCAALGRQLILASSEFEEWKTEEGTRISAARKQLEEEKNAAESAFASEEEQLKAKRAQAWSVSDIRSDQTVEDLGMVSRLSRRIALFGALTAGLFVLLAAACLLARMLRREKDDPLSRTVLPEKKRDIVRKAGLSLLIPAVFAGLLGIVLGRGLSSLLTRRCWSEYILPSGGTESFPAGLLLAVLLLILLTAVGLGILAAGSGFGRLLEGAAAVLAAALMSFVIGSFLWMSWGLFRSGQTVASRAPVFTSLSRSWSLLFVLLALFGILLLLPGTERLRAEEQRRLLTLMRVNGSDRRSCERALVRPSLLPAAAGALLGAGLGWFVFASLLPTLQQLDASWKILPPWLVWGLAVLLAWLLVRLIPAGVRRYAAADALTDGEAV
ncbi:MAG: hypothetical protein J5496_08455 [Lachnospiraceae bacterium]|nr:hypothetical protein [Lachnospiraceae bacterium]